VHHRCITGTAIGGIWRNRAPRQNCMVEPKLAAWRRRRRRIRLRGLLRENPAFAGFSYLVDNDAMHHRCITRLANGADYCAKSGTLLRLIRVVEPKLRVA